MTFKLPYFFFLILVFVGAGAGYAQNTSFDKNLKELKMLSYTSIDEFEELGTEMLKVAQATNNIDEYSQVLRLYGDRHFRAG
ncbi:MAG: hypothetical protein JKY54_05650, partial [Flavobacteriales bacterium]|nr:hypothetical protein [Flavobacteriales bacterium]